MNFIEVENSTTLPSSNVSGCTPLIELNSTSAYFTVNPCDPDYSEKVELKDILTNVVSALIAVVMIGIGCAVEVKKVVGHFKKPTGIISGLLCQYVMMPFLGLAWTRIFTMEDPETLSILIIGSCPGGTLSNIIAYGVGGDMELSTVMTTVSVTMSLGALPLLLYIYSKHIMRTSLTVPFRAIGITIAMIVFPISIGAFLRYKFPKAAKKLLRILSLIGIVILIGVGVFSIYLFHQFWSFQTGQIVTAVFYPLCGMCLGYAICTMFGMGIPAFKLTRRQKRTVSIETGIQNSQLAAAIIQLAGWPLDITGRVTVFPMLYAISQLVWSLFFIAGYHIISYARNGKCPNLTPDVSEDAADDPAKPQVENVENPAFNHDE